jgi:DNA repair photolyase
MSEYTGKIPFLSKEQSANMLPELLDPVEYRKSGLSLNHIIGCPLDCTYCVRHVFNNYEMRHPHRICSDQEAVSLLLNNKYFIDDVTPIQIFNRATDPMLPNVKDTTFNILELLAKRKIGNKVLVITRYKLSEKDAKRLNDFLPLKVVLLVTHSGIDNKAIEPVSSEMAIKSLKMAYKYSTNYKVILYWRPIVPTLNDSDAHIQRAAELSKYCHAVAFTGLFFRDQMKSYFESNGLPMLYDETARRKILPEDNDSEIVYKFHTMGGVNLFRKTSCAISFAYSIPDYNGHFGIRELCDICPKSQINICDSSWVKPSTGQVELLLQKIGIENKFTIKDRAVEFESLKEQGRYFIQHNLQFQAHEKSKPHHPNMHGRADIGRN